MRISGRSAVFAVLATGLLTACGSTERSAQAPALPQAGEPVSLDPADFSARIDHPYWPMRPGSRWVYRETDPQGAVKRGVVTVRRGTRRIANGVRARVVLDTVTEGGVPVEVTEDWYAQDRWGNVWYLGEDTKEYENGVVKTAAGSFEAGVDGAQAGVALPARPREGMTYRQEYYEGQAEDRASVFSLGERVEVPARSFSDVVMTRDRNPLKPKVLEYKFYARGVGPVLAIGVSGGADREELVSYTAGR